MTYRGTVKNGVVVLDLGAAPAPAKGAAVRVEVVGPSPRVEATPEFGFWDTPTVDQLAAAQGVGPIRSIDELRYVDPDDTGDPFEGFEEALREWRRGPWRGGAE